MKLRIALVVFAVIALLGTGVAVKYDLWAKFQRIGDSRTEAIANFIQLIRKDGVLATWKRVLNKLNNDPRLGLKYSLFDNPPSIESAEERAALPEFKIISAVDIATLPDSLDRPLAHDTWYRSNADDHSTKFAALEQIGRENARNLEVAWKYSFGGAGTLPVETNPVIVNGRLFVASPEGNLLSIDAESGREIWRTALPPLVARRGLVWEPNADFSKSRLFVPTGRGVYAINAASGEIQRDFGNGGQVGDQLSLIAPVIAKDRLIIAIIKPALEAYDLKTGKLIWSRPLIENLGRDENTLFTGAVPWTGMSYDAARARIYTSSGDPRPGYWGTSRPGPNLPSCSVVAVNTETGEIAWTFQEIAHDLWDLDLTGPPALTTIKKGGRTIDVVATVTKLGNTLLLDRDFGKPIFEYRLRRAPASKSPGEKTEPYQPDLELPELFTKNRFEPRDITDLSETDREIVARRIKRAETGFFVPPIIGGSVVMYGVGGGALWPGAAFDPRNGMLYVPSSQTPWIIEARYADIKGADRSTKGVPGDSTYQASCAGCHGASRQGTESASTRGIHYAPSLVGITLLRAKKNLLSIERFLEHHSDARPALQVSQDALIALYNYFLALDKMTDAERMFVAEAGTAQLFDSQGNPGSKPPWGHLTALNLNTGKKAWQIPFGEYANLYRGGRPVRGQENVGGTALTSSGLLFATGTRDAKLHVIDAANGHELAAYALPKPGSAPPSTYMLNGKQYVVVVASADSIVAFRLHSNEKK